MDDLKYMKRAFELALKSHETLRNPKVGAVFVKNGKIIAEGYHKKYGMEHAEINAINNRIEDLEGSTLYVNLEPCSHYGKQPPCVDKIIEHKIKRVVISNRDPNPKVDGIKKLLEHNIKVTTGILKEEGEKINEAFFTNIKCKRPFIALKYAMSLDGKIALSNYDSKWISSEKSREYVHKLRNDYDCVIIGKNTFKYDNPRLNVRLDNPIDPIRVIVSNDLDFDFSKRIFNLKSDKKTYIATSAKKKDHNYIINVKEKEGNVDIVDLVNKLYEMNVSKILVEGGSKINYSFLKKNLVDKIYAFIAPKIFVEGIAPFSGESIKEMKYIKKFNTVDVKKFDEDIMIEANRCLQE
ncbi:MAG: bifunctional diaminohydroxyphosphoribosylaminopyrimidine deaminase/5-amino-6-(5-phosphoribosylamino)uracil reductase RibD [Tissierellia bacterium]|nr:bifunctional diaminohydroxyphosphoribosylaminopyrimidine deaminase/5-amino-6-(5-phosphoribosylamino)uracil reductase RibD [Tissierellia bacterium]